jgi:regulator of sigma D
MTPEAAKQEVKDRWIQKVKAMFNEMVSCDDHIELEEFVLLAEKLLAEAGGFGSAEHAESHLIWPEVENTTRQFCYTCHCEQLKYHTCLPMCVGCSDRLTKEEFRNYGIYCNRCIKE